LASAWRYIKTAFFIETDLFLYWFSSVLGHNSYFIAIDLILGAAYALRSVIALEIRFKLGILSNFEVSGVVVDKCEFWPGIRVECDGSTKGVSQRRHLLNAHQLRILN
jgi:hypothetical protein